MSAASFFVTGGTLRPDAPSYVPRQADTDLYEGLSRGEFCYVLTARQMGKSSLMARTAHRLLTTGSWDGTAKLWDARTHRELARLTAHTAQASTLAFSPDGKTLATGSWDNTIKLWDVASHRVLATLEGTAMALGVAFSRDGRTLASTHSDKTVKLWHVATGQQMLTL